MNTVPNCVSTTVCDLPRQTRLAGTPNMPVTTPGEGGREGQEGNEKSGTGTQEKRE